MRERRGSHHRDLLSASFLICLLFRAQLFAHVPAQPPTEYQVKAAFLLNFTKFIEWPPRAFAEPNAPFTICILGDDPFGPALDQIVGGEKVDDRKLVVQRIHGRAAPGCQLLFVSNSERDVPNILASLGRGVLTVGDGEDFVREGGIIGFVVERRRVRFDINQSAAANAALKLSSKLLSVARNLAN